MKFKKKDKKQIKNTKKLKVLYKKIFFKFIYIIYKENINIIFIINLD